MTNGQRRTNRYRDTEFDAAQRAPHGEFIFDENDRDDDLDSEAAIELAVSHFDTIEESRGEW